ncbi:hypothetical protein H7992_02720 [Sporosarcina sp. resist]|uniref:hypothetical protein n=1 Tax=Sporosarcina sp. resist TaxID=2762563 RepID=UPI00164E76DE|nr:hypothetical protein [Sporosarcina sp. resist]QNK88700.1 hypothetical protein H7992_02720 [Sporosarcina sp. resist]
MQKKWKQTGAVLLIAGLTVTGTSYAWADEKANEPIDLSQLRKNSTTNVVEDPTGKLELPKVESVSKEDETDKEVKEVNEDKATEIEESVLLEIPEGYTAGNLVALGKAYEKVQNPTAKASIKRNMERSIEKWENKQLETETPEQPEVTEEADKQEAPLKEDKPAKVKQEKAPQAVLNAQHKEQRQELKANQKVEREALKTERKADKEQQKQAGNEKKN